MHVKDLKPNQGFDVVEGTVSELNDVRSFQKFGKEGRVRNGILKDESGDIKLTLWNDQIDKVEVGAKIKITNGYTSEWQGTPQISTGRNGVLEVLEGGAAPAEDKPAEETPQEDLDDLEVTEEEI